MKAAVLLVVVAVVCVVLFVTGVFSPRASRRLQTKSSGLAQKGENRSEKRAGKLGDVASKSLRKARHATDRSADKGREVHKKIWRG